MLRSNESLRGMLRSNECPMDECFANASGECFDDLATQFQLCNRNYEVGIMIPIAIGRNKIFDFPITKFQCGSSE